MERELIWLWDAGKRTSTLLSINWSDVWKMVESIKVPLIVIGVALTLAIIVSLAVFKMGKPARKLTRSRAWVAALVAVVVAVVSMMYGGFKTVLDLAAGTASSRTHRRPRWKIWATTFPTRAWSF